MKNFKQIAFGLIIGALAIGFSAFTNSGKNGVRLEILMNVTTPFRRKLTTHSGRN